MRFVRSLANWVFALSCAVPPRFSVESKDRSHRNAGNPAGAISAGPADATESPPMRSHELRLIASRREMPQAPHLTTTRAPLLTRR